MVMTCKQTHAQATAKPIRRNPLKVGREVTFDTRKKLLKIFLCAHVSMNVVLLLEL